MRNVKQTDLAKLADVTVQTVNRWAKGRSIASDKSLEIISKKYNVSFLWLREGRGPFSAAAVWGWAANQEKKDMDATLAIYERIDEIMTAVGINKEKLSAIADIKETEFDSDFWIGDGNHCPPIMVVEKIADATGYDKNWIWYGKGKKLSDKPPKTSATLNKNNKIAATITPGKPLAQKDTRQGEHKEDDYSDPTPSVEDLLYMCEMVLQSKTVYKAALASNARAFYKAVRDEEDMATMREELQAMKKENSERLDRIEALLLAQAGEGQKRETGS